MIFFIVLGLGSPLYYNPVPNLRDMLWIYCRRASSHDRENIGPRRDQRVFSRPKTSYSRRDAGNRISKAKMTKGSGRFSPDSPRSSPRSSDSFRMSSSSRRHINSKKYRRQWKFSPGTLVSPGEVWLRWWWLVGCCAWLRLSVTIFCSQPTCTTYQVRSQSFSIFWLKRFSQWSLRNNCIF